MEDDEDHAATAMVAEVRDGLLYVFMPPTEALEHFVDLIGRVQAAAAKVGCPLVIEGYGPPPDPRLKSTTITPDPGVIEVNIAPTASFAEQRRTTGNPLRASPTGPVVHRVVRRSTAATAAPAAVTTSPWAASPPRTRRCCAAPTCWSRC